MWVIHISIGRGLRETVKVTHLENASEASFSAAEQVRCTVQYEGDWPGLYEAIRSLQVKSAGVVVSGMPVLQGTMPPSGMKEQVITQELRFGDYRIFATVKWAVLSKYIPVLVSAGVRIQHLYVGDALVAAMFLDPSRNRTAMTEESVFELQADGSLGIQRAGDKKEEGLHKISRAAFLYGMPGRKEKKNKQIRLSFRKGAPLALLSVYGSQLVNRVWDARKPVAMALAVIVVLLVGVRVWSAQRISEMSAQQASFSDRLEQFNAKKNDYRNLAGELERYNISRRQMVSAYLRDLFGGCPANVRVTDVSVFPVNQDKTPAQGVLKKVSMKNEIHVSGVYGDFQDLNLWRQQIESHNAFLRVTYQDFAKEKGDNYFSLIVHLWEAGT